MVGVRAMTQTVLDSIMEVRKKLSDHDLKRLRKLWPRQIIAEFQLVVSGKVADPNSLSALP